MPPQTSRTFYRPELDALRLFAFLLVFYDHASGMFHSALATKFGEASRCGLPLFFLLSSYLITELLLREKRKTGTIHIKAFFVRRVLRIWPLYILFLTAAYVAGRLGHGYFPTRAFLAFLLISGNWYVYVFGFLQFAVGPLWSISVEEQFYLVWPFLVLLGGTRALKVMIPIVLSASAIAIWYSGHYGLSVTKYWTNSLIQFEYFAFGSLIALLLHGHEFTFSVSQRLLLFAGSFVAFLLLVFRFPIVADHPISTLGLFAAYGLMGVISICLFLGFYGMCMPPACAPFVYLGRISYGLYVFHLLLLQATEVILNHRRVAFTRPVQISVFLVALFITTGVAMASYSFLETPFLRLKSRFTFVHSRDA